MTPIEPAITHAASTPPTAPLPKPAADQGTVVTTTDELEAYFTIKAILHSVVSSKRIVMRDVQSYCGVLLDDNNRKPICRLYLSGARKSIGLFDNDERKEDRITLDNLEAIHDFADRLRSTAQMYEKKKDA